MAQDWLADVRRYDANADEAIVAGIVRHCGIALRSRDASLVSFSDSAETDRVRESFCKKKLALTDDDATLDAAIAAVGERMKGDNFKNRVTVYYLLAQHFGLLAVFAKAPRAKGAKAAAAPAAPAPAPASAPAPAPATATAPTAAPVAAAAAATPVMAAIAAPGGSDASSDGTHRKRPITPATTNDLGVGCLGGLAVLAAIIIAALISVWVKSAVLPEPAPEPAPVVAPAPPPAPAPVPEGAGVTAGERNGMPMLTVYFDTGSADVTPDFAAVSAELRAYLEANPDATVAISGYNDPSGDAALNAELSKNRAQGVQAALVAQGIAETRTDLVKPDDATTTDMTPAEARRVEITVVG